MADVQSSPLLTVNAAAKLLGIGRTTIYGLMDAGQLPYYRIGTARRVDPADLEVFKAGCRVGPARHNECGARLQVVGTTEVKEA